MPATKKNSIWCGPRSVCPTNTFGLPNKVESKGDFILRSFDLGLARHWRREVGPDAKHLLVQQEKLRRFTKAVQLQHVRSATPLQGNGNQRQWWVELQRKPFPSGCGKGFLFDLHAIAVCKRCCLQVRFNCFSTYSLTAQKGISVMMDSVPMTREGYNKIKAEIDRLENEEMPAVTEKIAEAREEGDLKENAEYHAQRENQGMLMAKIHELKSKIARASIVDVSQLPKDEVVFGCTVTVEDVAYGDEEQFTLVGAGEEDYDSGKILVTSPFGQGLIGKKVGETAEVEVPAGKLKFKILKIEFEV